MSTSASPRYLAAATGVAAAALLIGAYSLGASQGGGSAPATAATLDSASAASGRITVTGTGTVTGVPGQLTLSLGVQVNGYTVTSALDQADRAVRRVITTLRERGVAASDIQTSDLSIAPNYNNDGEVTSYAVSESLTATLDQLRLAGAQIGAAVQAGGNAVTIDGVSLNLTNTGPLMAAARARAVANARTQALQLARALDEPLGPVISVSQVQESTPPPVAYASNGPAAKSVPISPGTQQLSVSITVVYRV